MDDENREVCDLLQLEMEEPDALEGIEWDIEPTVKSIASQYRGHPLPRSEHENRTRKRRCNVLHERFVSATLRTTRHSRQDFSDRQRLKRRINPRVFFIKRKKCLQC